MKENIKSIVYNNSKQKYLGMVELLIIPLAWITFVFESQTDFQWFIDSSFILAVVMLAPATALIAETFFASITKNSYNKYRKYLKMVTILGFLIGIPAGPLIESVIPFAAIYINLISVHLLVSQYLGYVLFAFVSQLYRLPFRYLRVDMENGIGA